MVEETLLWSKRARFVWHTIAFPEGITVFCDQLRSPCQAPQYRISHNPACPEARYPYNL